MSATAPVPARPPDFGIRLDPLGISLRSGPPDAEGQRRELRFMHDVAASRTPRLDRAARQFAARGGDDIYRAQLERYRDEVGPVRGAIGTALVEGTVMASHAANWVAKKAFGRPRPYEVDPSLDAMGRSHGSSFPSGHTTQAAAAFRMLGALWPERRDEMQRWSWAMAQSRVYLGQHFPSDVRAGHELGTSVADAALAIVPESLVGA